MADSIAEIRKLFADNGVTLPQNDVWAVQGVPVVKHKALERLSAKLGIKWQEPKILRAERDEAVILVMGALGEHMEWSIGEAMIVPAAGVGGNYKVTGKQSSYVWAMSEKRGKDRVILKLAGIDAYSEEESDDFKDRQQSNAPQEPSSDQLYMEQARAKMQTFKAQADLSEWWKTEHKNRRLMLSAAQAKDLTKDVTDYGLTLANEAA